MAAKRAYYRRLDRNNMMSNEVQRLTNEIQLIHSREASLEAAVRQAGFDPAALVSRLGRIKSSFYGCTQPVTHFLAKR